MYRLKDSVIKPDGSRRNIYDAFPPLKKIHRRIKLLILDRIVYPPYLTGSLKGFDYKVNASLHAGAKIVINEDIKEFFPSTCIKSVYHIWLDFFGFENEVANCLAYLTTRKGELPQGAITSSFLANLAFWESEPALSIKFQASGLVYSRYVDDIAVSSKKHLTDKEKTTIISNIYTMLSRHGYKPKRAKHDIQTSGRRMEVTKLSVNLQPGLSKSKKSSIRSAVHHVEQAFSRGEITTFDSGPYAKVMGLVNHFARFHPGKGSILKKRLLSLKK